VFPRDRLSRFHPDDPRTFPKLRQIGAAIGSQKLTFVYAQGAKLPFARPSRGGTAGQQGVIARAIVLWGADPLADSGRKAITVAELCRQYLADVEAGRLLTRRKIAKKEYTLISDRGRIARHIIPVLGGCR
jgi:hypothetical protein